MSMRFYYAALMCSENIMESSSGSRYILVEGTSVQLCRSCD